MHWHLPILLGMLLTHAVIASNSSSRGAFLLPTTRARILATRTRTTVSAEYLSVSSSSSSTTTLSSADVLNKVKTERTTPYAPTLVFLPESKWRSAASQHSKRMDALLRPGLLSYPSQPTSTPKQSTWTALDPSNPIYNFLKQNNVG